MNYFLIVLGLIIIGGGTLIAGIGWNWEKIRKIKNPDSDGQKSSVQQKTTGIKKIHIDQSASLENSSQGNIYQAGGDINIKNQAQMSAIKAIQSITVEVRLTCDLKEGAELPPAEVTFIPVGDSHSYFKGAPGTVRLEFKSPVRFRRQDPDKIIVINRFALESGSELQHKPLATLKNFSSLSVPVVTVVYGKSFENFTLLEVILNINGIDIWYGSYIYDVTFEVGPRFEIPLNEFHKKLK